MVPSFSECRLAEITGRTNKRPASLGIVHQIQEFSCYTHSEFVGFVRGVGNSRGEVIRDPSGPSLAAEQLGCEIFERKYSDYRLDTQRNGRVWWSEL